MIKNRPELLLHMRRSEQIINLAETGLLAARPENFIRHSLGPLAGEHVHIISYGKAAHSMAQEACRHIKVVGGIIVSPGGEKLPRVDGLQMRYASHPIPDSSGALAARSILKYLEKLTPKDRVLFLISGGGSALISLPASPVTMKDAASATRTLLASGADIGAINCIRRHISQVAGGRLVSSIKCKAEALIVSDVRGNAVHDVSSGCTAYDPTTFDDALRHIRRLCLQNHMPKSVMRLLSDGAAGLASEGPKKTRVKNRIIASGKDVARAVAYAARQDRLHTRTMRIFGDVQAQARRICAHTDAHKDSCIVFYGEPTVRVTGKGRGGRSQELVLHLLFLYKKLGLKCVFFSIGTDGVDGNTKYAGAVADARMRYSTLEIEKYLKNNNSSAFFAKHRGLVYTGPTHTNLADVGAVIIRKAWQSPPLRH